MNWKGVEQVVTA